jgi:hypothetical protein
VDHPDSLESCNGLANLLWRTGQFQAAEGEHLRLLVARTNKLGPEAPATLTSLHNLCLAMTEQGKWEQAEPLARQASGVKARIFYMTIDLGMRPFAGGGGTDAGTGRGTPRHAEL